MGRPSTYQEDFCDLVIEWGGQGKSLTWMAAQLDVSRDTIYEWARTHKEFSDAITRAKAKCQAFWEDMGQNGCGDPRFNGGVWAKSMSARFPEEWRDNKGVELTGKNGGPVQVQALTDAALEAIAAGRGD